MTDTVLHTYRCANCHTVATAPFKAAYGEAVRCNTCYSFMKRLYSEPITTDAQRALALRGVVYNPGVNAQPNDVKRCDNRPACPGYYSARKPDGVSIEGVGDFCSAKCAEEGIRRHEGSRSQPPASLMGASDE